MLSPSVPFASSLERPNLDSWHRELNGAQDFDQVTEVVGRAFKPHAMTLRDPHRALNTHLYSKKVGQISLHLLEYGAEVKVEPDCFDGFVLVEIPLRGGGRYRCGRESLDGDTNHAVVMSPGKPVHLDLAPSLSQLIVKLDQQLVDRTCAAHLGYQTRDPVSFDLGLDLNGRAGRAWMSTLRHVIEGSETFPELLDNAIYCAHIEQMLIDALLYAHPHSLSHRFALTRALPSVAPAYVRRAVDYLESHAAEPITIETLAEAVGVSARALFNAFRSTFDQTPMGYLRELRLHRVREALLAGAPQADNLTQLAMQWGFFHYGRFAQYYGERFGERPQDTLRRARAGARGPAQ
ncbi:AraC family transcriptional regulator [Paraburkholderia acidisoli]|uniref:Helix-turn-helix domain-containing protein n=1 Tax=Paraburkholderia acidisoli TaxID=2571748 RepID=A0A7Z2GNF2_9BURK|nr:AraC family transcriptional regulator [Paraburkholderia acidisoli]QGZ65010.1 helix-turn-helix domain-containing protein [Paraburkholderia acidisoli]